MKHILNLPNGSVDLCHIMASLESCSLALKEWSKRVFLNSKKSIDTLKKQLVLLQNQPSQDVVEEIEEIQRSLEKRRVILASMLPS